MKITYQKTLLPLALTSLLAVTPLLANDTPKDMAKDAPKGWVDFGKFNPATSREFVEVQVPKNLIEMVTTLTKKSEPEVAQVLKGLQQIRVTVLGLTEENRAEIKGRVDGIRADLEKGGWQRIVTVMQDQQDIGVYMSAKGSEAVEGIVVTVLEANKQAVLINVVGDIRPENLVLVGERFNIEPLKKLAPRKVAAAK